MNDTKNAQADNELETDMPRQPGDEVTEIGSDELDHVCGGGTVGTDCTGGGGVHD